MKVYKKKYYILESTPGTSGFKRWNERTYCIATGYHAQHNKLDIVREFKGNGSGEYRLNDGHLPDYCLTANEAEALKWLDINFYEVIGLLNPEVYNLKTEV